MKLRDYQLRIINKIREVYKQGYRAPILRLDCGAGKTLTTLNMAYRSTLIGKRVLFLVHRKELLKQTYDALSLLPPTDKIQVGMILTVGNHLTDYNPDFIICDECNFALAKSWRKVLSAYPNAYILGLSATPCRLDGSAMGDIFDTIIEDVDAEWLIQHNYLAPYNYYAPTINLCDAEWKIKGSDYDQNIVAEHFDKSAIYGDILRYCDNLHKTIIYTPTVAYSKRLCDILNEHGFISAEFDAKTPQNERDNIIACFRNGDIRFLINVDLISFGFDCPSADRVFLLRPTLSLALYIQQACRCLRYEQGKTAEIYDFVGNVYRHGLPTDHREWSLTGKHRTLNPSGEKDILVRMCKSCFRVYSGTGQVCPYCGTNNGKTRKQIEQDKKAELERIEHIERVNRRKEIGRARTLPELLAIAHKRGYSPYWAYNIYRTRKRNGGV